MCQPIMRQSALADGLAELSGASHCKIYSYVISKKKNPRIYRYFLLDLGWGKCDNG